MEHVDRCLTKGRCVCVCARVCACVLEAFRQRKNYMKFLTSKNYGRGNHAVGAKRHFSCHGFVVYQTRFVHQHPTVEFTIQR